MNDRKLYFSSQPENHSLNEEQLLKKQARGGNSFYDIIGEETWVPRPKYQKMLNEIIPLREENKQLKREIIDQKNEYECKITEQKNECECKITEQKNEYECKITEQKNEYECKIIEHKNEQECKIIEQKNEYECKIIEQKK